MTPREIAADVVKNFMERLQRFTEPSPWLTIAISPKNLTDLIEQAIEEDRKYPMKKICEHLAHAEGVKFNIGNPCTICPDCGGMRPL